MSDIQDEAYTEAMDEISRLKQRLDQMSQKETYKEWQRNQAEIERLKGQIDVKDAVISKLSATVAEWRQLLTRAADAIWELSADEYPQQWMVDLLKELLKDAQ